jgi:hypothetical protein
MRIAICFYVFGIFLLLVSLLYGFTDIRTINYANPDVTTTFANINHNNGIIDDCVKSFTLGVLFIGAAALVSYFKRKSY